MALHVTRLMFSLPRIFTLALLAAVRFFAAAPYAAAQSIAEPLPRVFVTATRSNEDFGYIPFSTETISGDTLRLAPHVSIDATLRRLPGFSLFRRSDSLVAHPTTQGVSLRGLGPSGASRSLVLLDGVPLNDPFGGWVLWSKVPRESLDRIELVPGGGGTAWGNAALGGVIQLFTEPLLGERRRFVARAGSSDTYDVEGQLTQPFAHGTVQVLGRALTTNGYAIVAPEHRGPVDVPANNRVRWASARWRQTLSPNLTATLTVRRFLEDRGNGTPHQRNATRESFASVELVGQSDARFEWTATAYAQSQAFASTFSSVNPARTAETPASHQFDVPATAIGAAWVGEWSDAADARTSLGIDVRDVRGETREDSGFVGDAFTRRRFAGGRQTTAGAFVQHRRLLGNARASLGLRGDVWQDSDGHRRDWLNGAFTDEENYSCRRGVEWSPSIGLLWPAVGPVRVHANAQQAFRRPTLNELYRPFRVGNVITDANPALRTETVTSGEIGFAAEHGALRARVTGFWNELRDAVANVTIASGPANVPGIGFVPAGGEGRRRLNLDRTRVRGLSLDAAWKLTPSFDIEARYLYNDARVRRAAIAPWLVGRRLAQVPEHSASAGFVWKQKRWSIAPRVRWIGEQFEDDNNRLRLSEAVVFDVAISFAVRPEIELFASAENLFDQRIETGRASDGLVNTGTPRLLMLGLRWRR